MILATFRAWIRRPRPVSGGVMAELFAGNGEDADAVLALGRSAVLDATVSVALKDGADQDMGGFTAALRRPKATVSGMIACFMGEDGPAADAIVALGLSRFQNQVIQATVTLTHKPDGAPVEELIKDTGPYSAQATRLFVSDFITRSEVTAVLGGYGEFRLSLMQKPPAGGDFRAINNCLKEWSWNRLADCLTTRLGVMSMSHVPPYAVLIWATENGVAHLLPSEYQGKA